MQEDDTVPASEGLPVDPENEFRFLPPEEEPKLQEEFQTRAKKAITGVAMALLSQLGEGDEEERERDEEEEEEEEEEKEEDVARCCDPCRDCFQSSKAKVETVVEAIQSNVPAPTKPSRPKEYISSLTPQLKRASSMGFKMLKKVLFPAMPRFLQDLWVFLELAVTITSFILALVGFEVDENNRGFHIFYLVLSIISFVLALIDGYFYFIQTSYLTKCCSGCFAKVSCGSKSDETPSQEEVEGDEGNDGENEQEEEKGEVKRRWWQLSDNMQEKLDTWFELIRNLLSELLLYPLLICDLFSFVFEVGELSGELEEDTVSRVDFSLFIVGNIYLIISVYLMRVVIIIGTFFQIRRLPILPSNSGSSMSYLVVLSRFCIHTIGQIVFHAVILIAISAKIHHENPGDMNSIRASPFLWISLVLGGMLPVCGTMIFFLTNYYWMREFSISFWLDIMSLLQGESFAEVVFGGEGTDVAKSKAQTLAEKSEFSIVKKEYKLYSNATIWIKSTYPLRLPLLVCIGVVYDFAMLAFLASLAFSTDPDTNEVTFVLFSNTFLTTAFFLACVFLVIANFYVLLMINAWLLFVLVIFVFTFVVAVIAIPLLVLFYLSTVVYESRLTAFIPKVI